MSPRTKPNSNSRLGRREVIRAGGLMLAGLAAGVVGLPAHGSSVVDIRMRSVDGGGRVWFDPIGLFIQPGTTVRWTVESDVHTATAYHPANDGHRLRIPTQAEPWDSGYLVNPGDSFAVTLTVEGVYDYFCAPHELAGMVGRIIVGRPIGPGSHPFDDYKGDPAKAHGKPVPPAARVAFPSLGEIMRKRVVSPPGTQQ